MNDFVFLGPTLPRAEAEAIFPAHYLPPAAMGDVYALARHKPRRVAIIDGLFEQTPAVWHKEILYLLSRGVSVYGSSSMGALRAAELHTFGMQGVGGIFERYRDLVTEDDDEVTIAHGPASAGYRAISEAMVNLRLGLRMAASRGILPEDQSRALIDAMKQRFYPERSWAAVYDEARSMGIPDEVVASLRDFVRHERPDEKRADAILLLERLAAGDEDASKRPPAPSFTFECTTFWDRLTGLSKSVPELDDPSTQRGLQDHRVRRHAQLSRDIFERGRRRALLLVLVEREAERLGVTASAPEVSQMAEAFRRERDLLSTKAMDAWMRANHLTKETYSELMKLITLQGKLVKHHGAAVNASFSTALQLEGDFAELAELVQEKWKCLEESGISEPTFEDTGLTDEGFAQWYETRHNAVRAPNLDEHAQQLGFESRREFLTEAFAHYIYEQRRGAHR